MQIIPAIDMKDHQVVRLSQGRMEDAVVYNTSVVDVARQWVEQGAKRLHLVDLNGAFAGEPVHFDEALQITKEFPHIRIQLGGGIRDADTVQKYWDHGVDFCILGTVLLRDPELVRDLAAKNPKRLILGIDAKDGMVATHGWAQESSVSVFDVLQDFKASLFDSVIYTDIARDGMLSGMSFERIAEVAKTEFDVIASGGLTDLSDIKRLKSIPGISGVIAGKALYEGRFTLEEALQNA